RPITPSTRCSCASSSLADLAGHSGALQAAIAARVLGQILLVIVFREIEWPGGLDLGRNRRVARLAKRLAIGLPGSFGIAPLAVARPIDGRAVLRPDVVALAHPLGRVVRFEEGR